MVDSDDNSAGLWYVLQVRRRREIRDLQEVQEPVCNGISSIPGLEVIIDAGDLLDSEGSVQQLL